MTFSGLMLRLQALKLTSIDLQLVVPEGRKVSNLSFATLLQLTDFGLSRVGLINSTDDLSGPAAKTAMQVDESFPPAEYAKQRERRQQQSAVGTPDYLAPEILLGTGHGEFDVAINLISAVNRFDTLNCRSHVG